MYNNKGFVFKYFLLLIAAIFIRFKKEVQPFNLDSNSGLVQK